MPVKNSSGIYSGTGHGPSGPALPVPNEQEDNHSAQLTRFIRKEIGNGSIDFTRFMELTLYTPGLGYYSAGQQKFGEAGDFITAPELGPLFACCLARQCQQVLRDLDGGSILEVGGGSGALAADLLQELERLDCLPENYFILELSADLRARQTERLQQQVPQLLNCVYWLDTLPERGFRGIVIANELLDAIPVVLFHISRGDVFRREVSWEGGHFVWRDKPASREIVDRITGLDLPQDYISEINFQAESWVRSVAEILDTGVVLLIDYGFPRHEYYHPQRVMGTLMCHYRHRAHDNPLILVGLQDITAHIDFTAIAEAAVDSDMSVLGYTSQATFLMAAGLSEIATTLDPETNPRQHLEFTAQIKKLTLPSEMGELFKVIALGKEFDEPLIGFALQDRRGRL